MSVCVDREKWSEGKPSWHTHKQKKWVGQKNKSVCAFPAPYREGLAHEAATIKVISTFKVQY